MFNDFELTHAYVQTRNVGLHVDGAATEAIVMITGLRNTIIGLGVALGLARLILAFIVIGDGISLPIVLALFCILPLLPYLVFARLTKEKCSGILLTTGFIVLGIDLLGTYGLFFGKEALRGAGVVLIALFSTIVILPSGLAVNMLFDRITNRKIKHGTDSWN